MFNAGARMDVVDGRMKIRSEGKIKKLVPQVEQVSFSGPRALMQGQDITYITERCVMRLTPEGLTVTEIAPGISLQTDILDQSGMALKVSPSLRQMDARLYSPEPMGLTLDG
jgi:acyl CoA:acetate/3-ketoacid CoA transferase